MKRVYFIGVALLLLSGCFAHNELNIRSYANSDDKHILLTVINDPDFLVFSIQEKLEDNGFKVDLSIEESSKSMEVDGGHSIINYKNISNSTAVYEVTVIFHEQVNYRINGIIRDRVQEKIISRFQLKDNRAISWTILTQERKVDEIVNNFIIPSFSKKNNNAS